MIMLSTTRHHRIMVLATLIVSNCVPSSFGHSYYCNFGLAAFMLLPPPAEPFLILSSSPSPVTTKNTSFKPAATRITTSTTSDLSCAAFGRYNNDDDGFSSMSTSSKCTSSEMTTTTTNTSLHYKNDCLSDEQPPPSLSAAATAKTTTTMSYSAKTNVQCSTNNKPPKIHPASGGRITLVGAGPGSPDLLTMAAHRIISDPNNLIIVDRLVSHEIVELIQGEYRVANKHPGCAELAQQEIYEWCKEGIRMGRHVVRLKIGDPFVFGRGGEEVLEFREFGVEPSIIPGVSAAFSAPLLGSIPVTHRGVSNQVVMCTGYGRDGTSPDLIQYHKEQTVVFLMAVGRLRTLCHNLVTKAHYPTDTPVGIVERAGCPDQRTIVGNMETIADLAEKYDVKPPSTIVVGEVVNVLLTEDDFDFSSATHGSGIVGDQRREGLLIQSTNIDLS